MMVKRRFIEPYLFITWCFISPTILLLIIIRLVVNPDIVAVNGKALPNWAQALGWLIVVLTLLPIPVFAVYEFIKAYKIRHHLKVRNFFSKRF